MENFYCGSASRSIPRLAPAPQRSNTVVYSLCVPVAKPDLAARCIHQSCIKLRPERPGMAQNNPAWQEASPLYHAGSSFINLKQSLFSVIQLTFDTSPGIGIRIFYNFTEIFVNFVIRNFPCLILLYILRSGNFKQLPFISYLHEKGFLKVFIAYIILS